MNSEHCALFPVKSGVPVIALGMLLLVFPVVSHLVEGYAPLPLPISMIFIATGIFMIWLGLRK